MNCALKCLLIYIFKISKSMRILLYFNNFIIVMYIKYYLENRQRKIRKLLSDYPCTYCWRLEKICQWVNACLKLRREFIGHREINYEKKCGVIESISRWNKIENTSVFGRGGEVSVWYCPCYGKIAVHNFSTPSNSNKFGSSGVPKRWTEKPLQIERWKNTQNNRIN